MKKITLSVLAVLTMAATITSCKKGENDPAISLRSRKARVAGEWTVSSYESTNTNSSTSQVNGPNNSKVTLTNSSTTTESHDGSTLSTTYSGTSQNYNPGSNTTTSTTSTSTGFGTVTKHDFTFEKDGTWTLEHEYSTKETRTVFVTGTRVTDVTYVIKSSGVWNFTGKIGEAKNKENIVLSTLSEETTTTRVETTTDSTSPTYQDVDTDVDVTTNTYAENENTSIWKITQLKNKEMMVEGSFDGAYTGTSTNTSSSTFGGTTTTTTSTSSNSGSHNGTVKMTLTAK